MAHRQVQQGGAAIPLRLQGGRHRTGWARAWWGGGAAGAVATAVGAAPGARGGVAWHQCAPHAPAARLPPARAPTTGRHASAPTAASWAAMMLVTTGARKARYSLSFRWETSHCRAQHSQLLVRHATVHGGRAPAPPGGQAVGACDCSAACHAGTMGRRNGGGGGVLATCASVLVTGLIAMGSLFWWRRRRRGRRHGLQVCAGRGWWRGGGG